MGEHMSSTTAEEVAPLSTLAYGLLGLLTRGPKSGYDLMLLMRSFHWSVSHSQIYPLLAKHEQTGLVSATTLRQVEKPDKKLYTLTAEGLAAVEEWLLAPTAGPDFRDELVLKAYCLGGAIPPERAKALFTVREAVYAERYRFFQAKFETLKEEVGGSITDFNAPAFGRFIVVQKGLVESRQGIDWCRWVLALLEAPPGTNLFDLALEPYGT